MVEIQGWGLAWGNLSDGSFDKTRQTISIVYIKGWGSVKGGNSIPKEGGEDCFLFLMNIKLKLCYLTCLFN